MRRLFPLGLIIASASLSMGCATCCSPYDYAFGYYGGAWRRDDLCNGRVGSVFAPAGTQVYVPKQKTETQPPPPNPLAPPETAPEAKPKSDLNADASPRPLKSVKRTRPASAPRSSLPVND
jgi:hypothetical protein